MCFPAAHIYVTCVIAPWPLLAATAKVQPWMFTLAAGEQLISAACPSNVGATCTPREGQTHCQSSALPKSGQPTEQLHTCTALQCPAAPWGRSCCHGRKIIGIMNMRSTELRLGLTSVVVLKSITGPTTGLTSLWQQTVRDWCGPFKGPGGSGGAS